MEIAAEPTAAMVLYDPRVQEQAVKMARELRNQQKKTVLIRKSSKISLTEYKNFALRKEFQQALWLKEDKSIVSLLEGGAL